MNVSSIINNIFNPNLKGKTVVITGAGGGIGRAVALAYGQQESRLGITDRNKDSVVQTFEVLKSLGINDVLWFTGDVTNKTDTEQLMGVVAEKFGGGSIDVVNNIAGITADVPFHKMSEEQWRRVLDVNLTGTFITTQASMPFMREIAKKEQSVGLPKLRSIVNVSSVSAKGNPGQANYAASKAAVEGFTKTIAAELAPFYIKANAVAPGFIDTQMTQAIPEKAKDAIAEIHKRKAIGGRFGQPDDIARVILFLGSDLSGFMTGQVLVADGGLTTGVI